MSLDTIGSSIYFRISFNSPSEASLNFSFTSSRLVSFSTNTFISIIDPSGTGTLIANASKRPLSSGYISKIAFAAPVDVGTILTAAALALLGSLWIASRSL